MTRHLPPILSALCVTIFVAAIFANGTLFGEMASKEIVQILAILVPVYICLSDLSNWLVFKKWGFIVPLLWGCVAALARAVQSATWPFISWDFYWGGILYAFIYGTGQGLVCAFVLAAVHFGIKRIQPLPAHSVPRSHS